MPKLLYYYDLMSQPCRALYIFLKMTKIPFDAKEIAIRKGEHLTSEYEKLNPMKKVPVIDDNGFVLTESVAIFQYLCDKYKNEASSWYPPELEKRARVNEYSNWQHLNLRANGSMLFRKKIINPKLTNTPPNEKELNTWYEKWQESTKYLEKVFLRTNYLAGDQMTFADLLGACELMQPIGAGFDIDKANYPKVVAWFERVKSETQPFFDEAHKLNYRMRERVLEEQSNVKQRSKI
ncbi:unnamed protein product [Didymodactylos carnosus]|uniref:Glutathione S-transferase n=1 Tax=Didymodactylos carnosus TaxID=1234261 RepID=A0A814QVB4_9BILA|nr:unnamed protein product [Didymodactylos carnosus]CAF1125381.1 unnamed protein product [Didymodactylos carnosus]CAF3850605.1 unnamed protein product [Didymodactylos carnosus]CAF3888935.1 unnamed protein product [Didymodactylos carnosus]